MKRILQATVVFAMIAILSDFAVAQTFTYPVKGRQGFSLSEKTRDGLHVSYNLGQFTLSPIDYRGESMSEISISGMVLPNEEGCPNLPVESRLLAMPQGAEARLNIVNIESEIVRDVDIAPALRVQTEDEEPEFNYVKNQDVYGRNAFYPENPFTIDRTSIRGVDVVAVSVSPFQYNPVTKELKVYTNIELSISFEGGNGHFGDDRLRSPYWDPILAAELMNYDQLPVIDYAARMQHWLRDGADGAEYLIITPNNDAWAQYANQLRDYRMRQGILTKVYRLDEMPATTTTEMKNWFHNAYNTWDIPPVAVCLMGDHGTNLAQYIPAETVSHPSSGSCISDNRYADVDGDNLPDMVFSRLIAETADQLPVFVGKQLEYEYTNPNMDPNFYANPITALGWQTERWFQICSEVFGGYMRNKGYNTNRINCIYQGTPGSSWSSNQNTSMVVNYFGPNGLGYIPQSPSELGGWTGGTPQQVLDAVNAGTFWLQHRDHGLETGWGEPAVRNSHVNQTTNVGKLPFVMSINCLTGMFNYSSDCFCEAWMRRTYNGQNAGAVGVLCPTEISYSFVNDAFVWGVYDLFDGDFMPDYGPYAQHTGNWMPAFGNVAGKYFLAQSAWPYNSNSKDITYTMFTAHCDAFLRIYTQVPQTMDVTHSEAVVAGYGGVTVSAPEGCMISLVKANADGGWDILAVASATGSSQVIEFEPQLPPTVINIIVTGQNYLRYEDTIEVIPAQGSYLVVDGYTPQTTPINQQTALSMSFRNVGLDATSGTTTVTVSSSDERITVIDGTGQFGVLTNNQVVTLQNEFSFIIAQDVPDGTRLNLNVTMTCGSNTWTGGATITAAQALPVYDGMSWAEIFDPGQTLTVTATFRNNGHYQATNAVAQIASTSPYISFVNNTYTVGTLEATSQVDCTFDVVISPNCPETEQIPITFTMNADGSLTAQGSGVLKNTIVTVSANPQEGGTVSGAGKCVPGSTCTITATPNDGYVFVSWKLNGSVVSYLPTYSPTINESSEFVANFQAVTNGVVVGNGSEANAYLPSYSYFCYTLSQQIYTADEIGIGAGQDISSVSFFNTGTSKTRTYTIYMVNTSKTSFESNTDWITVSEADQVFSGSVSMASGSWKTIYFDTPFEYDGSSNIALIVDDNTGSWSSSNMTCRVSPTENNQSIYVYSDNTNYDPYNPSVYTGTCPMVKNHVIFGIASYDYTVSVTANPLEGGTVSGGGLYYYGQPITLTATPNTGYVFSKWTKNGSVVSYLSTCSVSVTESATYVAHFDVIPSGFAIGSASSTIGCLPVNVFYNYSLTQQIYTAEEIGTGNCNISSVAFFNTSYGRTRDITVYMVNTTKTAFESTNDWITVTEADQVFSGTVNFASYDWTTISFNTLFNYDGNSNIALIIDDNTGSYVSSSSFRVSPTESNQSIYVYSDGTNYDPYSPTSYSGTRPLVKNQVIFGVASYDYTVTVAADPTTGGTVSGGGLCYYGQSITLTATPNTNYIFLNWTKDGNVVSHDQEFNYTVTGSANLVAHFTTVNPGNINFADANVKAICVANWDTNGDGELSYLEAAMVTSLGEVFRGNTEITSFEELQYFICLQSIGNNAFRGCTALTGSLILPSSITSIGNYAFYNCYGFTGTLDIPGSVTSIGNYAFYNCYGFTGTLDIPGSVTSIGNYAFQNCHSFTGTLTIPSTLTTIGNSVFYSCYGFTAVEIPNTWTTINTSMFSSCYGLTSVEIPNSVTSIGGDAFYYCYGLTSVEIPNSVTSIGSWAFGYCYNLPSIEIPNSVTSISNSAFYNCTGLTSIEIPSSVSSIGSSTFSYCTGLISVEIPNSVTTINSSAFYNCYNLTSIEIPASVTSIGTYAFGYCNGLNTMVVWAETPPTLGDNTAFYNVTKTIPVYVPCGSVNSYQNAQYWNEFTNLTELCSGEVVVMVNPSQSGTVTGAGYYNGGDICVLTATPNPGYGFANWTENGVLVSRDPVYSFYAHPTTLVANFCSDENIIFADANVKALCVANWDTNGDGELSYAEAAVVSTLGEVFRYKYSIYSFNELQYFIGLTSIGSNAFYNCSGLVSVKLPASVTSIGSYAFAYCYNLPTIEIPNSVTSIGSNAFASCSNLSSIEIPNSVTTINNNAFTSCYSLLSIEIPNSVTTIGYSAFSGCYGLNSIEIPNSVTTIGYSAFSNCTGLTSVVIPSSVTSIGTNPFSSCRNLEQIVVDAGNTAYDSRGNCNAIINSSTNELVSGCKNTVIPNTVTSIGASAFYYCYALTSIEIPNTVTSIGSSAFYYCTGLTSIEIPSSVTSLSSTVFSYCYGLTSLTVFATTPPTVSNSTFNYMNKDVPVRIPCGTMDSYTTATYWSDFTNYHEVLPYHLSVSASNANWGTVHFVQEPQCDNPNTIVEAVAHVGYAFVNWTENGQSVCTDATYSFNLTSNRDLVANFTPLETYWQPETTGYSDNMSLYGVIQIDGVEQYSNQLEVGVFCGNECRGTAIASYLDLTQRYLVVETVSGGSGNQFTFKLYDHGIGQELNLTSPAAISFNEDGYGTPIDPYVLNFTSAIAITATADPEGAGTITGTGGYTIGATCTLVAEANTGYQFKNWTLNGTEVSTNASYQFTVTGSAAYVAHFQRAHTQALSQGWNWWSTYIEQDDINGLEMLENSLGNSGIRIQGRNDLVDRFDYQGSSYWYGSLTDLTNEQMYKVRTNAACNVVIVGEEALPSNHPITISNGWNWIGYPCGQSQNVNAAMSGFTPEANDVIKSKDQVATYISYGTYNAWYGSLNTLDPGLGYMYKSNSNATKTLVFQTGLDGGTMAHSEQEEKFFRAEASDFADNMVVTAVVELAGEELRSEDYELAAFVGDECRGSVRLMYVEPFDRYIAFLLVSGESAEEMSFVLTDGESMSWSDSNMTFSVDGMAGTATDPVTLRFGTLGVDDNTQHLISIFPNPSNGIYNIEGRGIRKVNVVDAYGQVVLSKEIANDFMQIDLSNKAAGVYMLQVVTDRGITTRQLIKK